MLEQHYFDVLLTCLNERDANWLENWVDSHPDVPWKSISSEFIDHFKSVNAKSDWLRKLRKLEMKATVQEYTDEALELMHKLAWDTMSEEAIMQYKLGLPRWMLNQLSSFESHNLTMEGIIDKLPKICYNNFLSIL